MHMQKRHFLYRSVVAIGNECGNEILIIELDRILEAGIGITTNQNLEYSLQCCVACGITIDNESVLCCQQMILRYLKR